MKTPLPVCALLSAFFALAPGAAGEDQVFLKDGAVLRGEIVDLGRNWIELRTSLGSRKVRKRDIERIAVGESTAEAVLDVDRVVLRDGRIVKGEVTVSADGTSVSVRVPGRGAVIFPRSEVAKIVPRGEAWGGRPAATGARELDKLIRDLVEDLGQGGRRAAEAQRKLKDLGIFAKGKLAELRDQVEGERKERIQAVLTSYELRKVVSDTLDSELPEIYESLEAPQAERRIEALKAALVVDPLGAVQVLCFKLRDPQETDTVRAFCVEVLRRLNRYRELIQLYNEAEGALAFALAVALAENGIYLGIPALIAALEEPKGMLRDFAARKLAAYTGEDHRPKDPADPKRWEEAAKRYRSWWAKHKEQIRSQVQALLARKPADTPQRARALEYWRRGNAHLSAGRLLLAEKAFQQALAADPSFARAALCLGIVLAEQKRSQQAVEVLTKVTQGRYPDSTAELEAQAAYHLGELFRRQGELSEAAQWYCWALRSNPRFIEAHQALGETYYRSAVSGSTAELTAEKRRSLLQAAEQSFQAGLRELERYSRQLLVLPVERIPGRSQLPFGRQSYRLSLKSLRDHLKKLRSELSVDLARVYLALGQLEKAEAAASRAVQDDPQNPAFQLLLALVFDREGKHKQALRHYRRVLKLDPENPVARKREEHLAGAASAEP